MAMGHEEVCEDKTSEQTKKRRTGEDIIDSKTGLPVQINCVQCGMEIKKGYYCSPCGRL